MKDNNKMNTLCPLPWLHFSAHLDSTMRICCNTDHMGFVYDNNGSPIKLSEVNSINEYFNLDFYKSIRKEMLSGCKPETCKKCYQVEAAGGTSVRQGYLDQFKRNETFQSLLNSTDSFGNIDPKVLSLDFSLSNNCNLKCIMCSPDASFPIKADFDKLGINYDVLFTEGANKNWRDLKALERLIPEISTDLSDFLTTGGEPFLSKPHKFILELLIKEQKSKQVSLSYHTNCTVKNNELFKLWNEFKAVRLHFSIDAFGPLDEYIRHKTNWSNLEENVKLMLSHPKVSGEVHSCVQVLNLFGLTDLYDWIKTYRTQIPMLPIHIWMHNPAWLHINILPSSLKEVALDKLTKYFENEKNKDHSYEERSSQILSFINRSLEEKQDLESLEIFKERIKKFEEIRGQTPVEKLVPELKELFPRKKKFFFF